ncbi:MAG: hypothetical protein IPH53_01835 [Flavobacteriales bacterium]|nr:hypothetical protein [Flavobacteriales bacterium]
MEVGLAEVLEKLRAQIVRSVTPSQQPGAVEGSFPLHGGLPDQAVIAVTIRATADLQMQLVVVGQVEQLLKLDVLGHHAMVELVGEAEA